MKISTFLSLSSILFLAACSSSDFEPTPDPKPTPEPTDTYELMGKWMLDEIFDSYYWWNDKTPSSVDWNSDFYDYFDKHLVSEDRWSWMTSGEEFRESQQGVSSGSYGFALGQPIEGYDDYRIYVKYVLPDTPMAAQGVCRGWRMDVIGNYQVANLITSEAGVAILNDELDKDSNHFEFWDGEQTHSFDVSKAEISTRSYLVRKVYASGEYPDLDHPVGYFNYYTFNDYLSSDIPETISMFRDAGVTDLILDLRYNGGGSTSALSTLVDLLAPAELDGEVFAVTEHNQTLKSWNDATCYDVNPESLALNRLYVITGSGTASASEVLINGLRDGLGAEDLILVGGTTYGKPNGMYAFAYPEGTSSDYYGEADYVYLPICFYTTNRSGQYIPDEGFTPDIPLPDDLYHDWGSGELLIKTCLDLITGAYIESAPAGMVVSKANRVTRGHRLSSEEDSDNYGRLIAPGPRIISE